MYYSPQQNTLMEKPNRLCERNDGIKYLDTENEFDPDDSDYSNWVKPVYMVENNIEDVLSTFDRT